MERGGRSKVKREQIKKNREKKNRKKKSGEKKIKKKSKETIGRGETIGEDKAPLSIAVFNPSRHTHGALHPAYIYVLLLAFRLPCSLQGA